VSSWVSKTLPIGSLTPCVLVRDAIGSITFFQSEKVVTVEKMQPKAGQSLSGALKQKMDALLAAASGDPVAVMEVVSGMASSINSDTDTTAAAAAAAEAARATMASSLEDSLSSSEIDPTSVMSTAAAIALKPSQLNSAARTSLKKAMVAVLDKVTELEPDAGQSVLSTLSNVQSAAKPTTTAAKKAEADAFAANLKSLTSKMSAAMVPGAPVAVLKTATVETQLQKNTATEAVKKTIGGCKVTSFGVSQRRSAPPSVVTTSVIKTANGAIGYAYVPGGDLIKSEQVGLTILGDNNAELSMNNMSTPAEVTITLVSSTKNPQCVFYDTTQGVWATTGLSGSATTAETMTITCKTSHLTDFAVQSLPPLPPLDPLSAVLSQSVTYATISNWTGHQTFYKEGYMAVAGWCESSVVRCNKETYKYTGVELSATHSTTRRSSIVVYTVELVKSNAPSALSVSAKDINALAAAIKAAAAAVGSTINVTVTNIAEATVSANSTSPSRAASPTLVPVASSSGGMLIIVLAVVGGVVVLGIIGVVVGLTTSRKSGGYSKNTKGLSVDAMIEMYEVHPNEAISAVDDSRMKEQEKMTHTESHDDQNEAEPEEQSTLLGASIAIAVNKNVEDDILSITGIPLSELDGLVIKYFSRYDIDGTMLLKTNDELLQLLCNLCYKVTSVSTAAGNLAHMADLVHQKSQSVRLGEDNAWDVETFRAWFYDEFILQKPAGCYDYPPMDNQPAPTQQPKTKLRAALQAVRSPIK